jgi:hypothetical protein
MLTRIRGNKNDNNFSKIGNETIVQNHKLLLFPLIKVIPFVRVTILPTFLFHSLSPNLTNTNTTGVISGAGTVFFPEYSNSPPDLSGVPVLSDLRFTDSYLN